MAETEDGHLDSFEKLAHEQYCIVGQDGEIRKDKVARVLSALRAAGVPDLPVSDDQLPDVPGVPRLKARLDDPRDIAAAARKFLPLVESDPRLHRLSFVNPLRLATDELGIAISPVVARFVRRTMRGAVSFDDTTPTNASLRGITRIRWILKPSRPSNNRARRNDKPESSHDA